MDKKNFGYSLKVGNTRRKIEALDMLIGMPECRGEDNDWVVNCSLSGFYSEEKKVEGRSAFDCFVCGLAYLRQTIRFVQSNNPKLKLFFEFDGSLEEIEIDDVFMTHDCITDEIEEMIEWAQDNGFEPES